MARLVLGWILSAALLAGAAQAAPEPEPEPRPIDRSTALQASPEDLASGALAAVAARFVEVQRPDFAGYSTNDGPLQGLRFATAARMAGETGLCEATTAWIGLAPGSPPIETATVYKVVGDLAPLPDMWNPAYEAELTRKCASTGRVLVARASDFDHVGFFELSRSDGERAWMGPRALQLAIAGAKSTGSVTCVPESSLDDPAFRGMAADAPEAIENQQNLEGCARAEATLAGLSLDRLLRVDISPCPNAGEQARCLSASFLRYAYGNHQALWLVTLRYQESEDRDVASIDAVTLKPGFIIYH
jgi:hypothetical protein